MAKAIVAKANQQPLFGEKTTQDLKWDPETNQYTYNGQKANWVELIKKNSIEYAEL